MSGYHGNQNAEKWTKKKALKLYSEALEMSNSAITLTDITNELGVFRQTFEYLAEKFKDDFVFSTIKKQIKENIANNTYKGAIGGQLVPSIAIFGLKNNHGWSDKSAQDQPDKQTESKDINITINPLVQLGDGLLNSDNE